MSTTPPANPWDADPDAPWDADPDAAPAAMVAPHRGVDRAKRKMLEENLVQIDPRLSGAAHIDDVAAGTALPVAVAGGASAMVPILAGAGASGAIGGGVYGGMTQGPKGIIPGAAEGFLLSKGVGLLGKFGMLSKLAKVAQAMGLMKGAPNAVPGALTQQEMLRVVSGMAKAEPGAVMNPSVATVAENMNPPLMSMADRIKIARGGLEAEEQVKAQLAQRLDELMTGSKPVPLGTPGEMRTVLRGAGKPTAGWVENPSPEMVAKYMQPAVPEGVDPQAVAALQKWGMSFDDAVRLAAKAQPAPAVAPAAARSVAPAAPAVPMAAPVETAPATLISDARAQLEALLGSAVKEGRVAAAAKEAAKGNRQLAEKILGELQGEGVIAP